MVAELITYIANYYAPALNDGFPLFFTARDVDTVKLHSHDVYTVVSCPQ